MREQEKLLELIEKRIQRTSTLINPEYRNEFVSGCKMLFHPGEGKSIEPPLVRINCMLIDRNRQ